MSYTERNRFFMDNYASIKGMCAGISRKIGRIFGIGDGEDLLCYAFEGAVIGLGHIDKTKAWKPYLCRHIRSNTIKGAMEIMGIKRKTQKNGDPGRRRNYIAICPADDLSAAERRCAANRISDFSFEEKSLIYHADVQNMVRLLNPSLECDVLRMLLGGAKLSQIKRANRISDYMASQVIDTIKNYNDAFCMRTSRKAVVMPKLHPKRLPPGRDPIDALNENVQTDAEKSSQNGAGGFDGRNYSEFERPLGISSDKFRQFVSRVTETDWQSEYLFGSDYAPADDENAQRSNCAQPGEAGSRRSLWAQFPPEPEFFELKHSKMHLDRETLRICRADAPMLRNYAESAVPRAALRLAMPKIGRQGNETRANRPMRAPLRGISPKIKRQSPGGSDNHLKSGKD